MNFSYVVNFVNTTIVVAASWFISLLESSGGTPFYVAAFFVFLLGRFILRPIFGVAQSDTARKIYNGKGKSNKSGGGSSNG